MKRVLCIIVLACITMLGIPTRTLGQKLSIDLPDVTESSAPVGEQPFGVLLNEIEIDPPSTTSDSCQYVELRGAPGSTIPANTYFIDIDSGAGNFGVLNQVVNIGGRGFGPNGTIVLINVNNGFCPGRNLFTPGSRVIGYQNPTSLSNGSEAYLLVQSTTTLNPGQDVDTNNDFNLDPALGITAHDGFALLANPGSEPVYGDEFGVVNISNTSPDQPDAVTRCPGNQTSFAASAFYYGELAAAPDSTTTYVAPFSANFPPGGMLTPSAQNVGTCG